MWLSQSLLLLWYQGLSCIPPLLPVNHWGWWQPELGTNKPQWVAKAQALRNSHAKKHDVHGTPNSVTGRGSSKQVKNSFLHYWLRKITYIFHSSYELENYQWVNTSMGSCCPFIAHWTSYPEIWVTQIRLHEETPAPAEIPALQGFISSDFLMLCFKKNNTAPWADAVQPPRQSAMGRIFVSPS